MIQLTSAGFYCDWGDFYIDPWKPVKRALVTHGHADHARRGSESYLAAEPSFHILRQRLGKDTKIQNAVYGKKISVGGGKVSFHPAGHILGSAQIRLEYRGEIWVVSGDYKLQADSTCDSFEPVPCHTFLTESTFGLPVFNWNPPDEVFNAINRWWENNRQQARTSILFTYALGKSQRVLTGINTEIGPIYTHGAVEKITKCYREAGVLLPKTEYLGNITDKDLLRKALIIAPPSADNPGWLKKFPEISRAYTSGWMQLRGNRRRLSLDSGFILSDHADWKGINEAILLSGANTVWVTHGYSDILTRWLSEKGYQVREVQTAFEGEVDDSRLNSESRERL